MDERVDIKENYIYQLDSKLLEILLKDHSSGKNIIWATDNYQSRGSGYYPSDNITLQSITGRNGLVIKPRVDKSKKEQEKRIKDKAEVFTPSWLCNQMANNLDSVWFERPNIFNIEKDKTWQVTPQHIEFSQSKTWQDYVTLKVLEITCGEAPFLASRYDTVTGEWLDPNNRIGILDRKLRVIGENMQNESEWFEWVLKAYKCIFGYEWQGDSLLIARENLLFTFIDYYVDKFGVHPIKERLEEIAKILSWNIFQMDGLKCVVPNSCKKAPNLQISLFEEDNKEQECIGCQKHNNNKHTGIYCKVMNWQSNRTIKFLTGEKKMKFDFVIGNPPYQTSRETTKDMPVYHEFMDAAYSISSKVELITPARFLFNAGATSKSWNEKMLKDTHFKVIKYETDSSKIFSNTDIKGGLAITYRDANKDYGAIENFSVFTELNSILLKVRGHDSIKSINTIMYPYSTYTLSEQLFKDYPEKKPDPKYPNDKNRLSNEKIITTNIFDLLPEIFYKTKPDNVNEYCKILGRKNNERTYMYVNKKYINVGENYNKYKVLIPVANGSGAIGEVLSTPLVGTPLVGYTQSFLGVGSVDTQSEAEAIYKYICSKFARVMLGILKITQHNPPAKWRFVPIQDFTKKSDIDWNKSIHEIDLQLYKKYGLEENEIAFIESHVKEMK